MGPTNGKEMLVPAMWEALSLLTLLPLAAAYECTVTSHEDMTNYGELAPSPLAAVLAQAALSAPGR